MFSFGVVAPSASANNLLGLDCFLRLLFDISTEALTFIRNLWNNSGPGPVGWHNSPNISLTTQLKMEGNVYSNNFIQISLKHVISLSMKSLKYQLLRFCKDFHIDLVMVSEKCTDHVTQHNPTTD